MAYMVYMAYVNTYGIYIYMVYMVYVVYIWHIWYIWHIYIYIYGDVYFVSVSRMGYQIHHGTFATEWLWKILFSRFAGGARAAHAPGACAGSFKRRFPAMSPSPATWLCPFHAGGYASLPPPSACRCQQNSCCEAPACMAVEVFRGAPPSKFPITETK